MMIEAKMVAKSVGEHSPPLGTFFLRYPKFIHSEFMTHRMFSRNASSSRAIPVRKNLEEVRSDELRASPVWWGKEQKGMESGEELEDKWYGEYHNPRRSAIESWRDAAWGASRIAEIMCELGVHKSIVNRILEPFLHIKVVMTSCEPGLMNFFGLRLDHAAQPEIRVLAEAMWKAWSETDATKLKPGEWHLPFVDIEDVDAMCIHPQGCMYELPNWECKVSAARCARTSYLSFETGKRSTVEEDLRLYAKLVEAQPMHLSPLEHQATPDLWMERPVAGPTASLGSTVHDWARVALHGNLPGWVQFRKTIPGEGLALLPKELSLS